MVLLIPWSFASCELQKVVCSGTEVLQPFGEAWVPAASLVRPVADCEGGRLVELVSPVWQYQKAGREPAAVGARACLPSEALGDLEGHRFLDQNTGAVHDCCACASAPERPVSPEQFGRIERVAAAYEVLWGPVNRAWIRVTEWGKVGLPLDWHDPETIRHEELREGLVSEEQKEKAVVAHGGNYLHFLGSDAPYSDIWGTEAFILELMRLSAAWETVCPAEGAACTVQFGDISYYNTERPDPLGHADHWPGTCVDIRLFRSDGSRYEAWWNQPDDREGSWTGYDQATTLAFTAFLRARDPVKLFFNDPTDEQSDRWRGHDDHIHYCP